MARKKSAVLTDMQQKVVDAKLEGMTDSAALKKAGYNTNNTAPARTEAVKQAIEEARNEIKSVTTLTRVDIIDGILDAIQMARTAADPGNMINGYDKLAKIIGAYEPERVKVELSKNSLMILKKMEAMTREELLAIADGNARVIDGEFVRVAH